MEIFILAFVSSTFLLAGFVKGLVGLGLPTIAMGLLAVVMTPAQAAALLVVPSFITNVWQAAGPQLMPLLRRLWPMLLGICAGTWAMRAWAGAGLLTADNGSRASMWLGAVLALYAALGLAAIELSVPSRLEPWLSPPIGVLTGIVTAATGVYMIPSVPYLQALGLEKDALVQSLGVSFTVSTLALAILLVHDGALQTSVAGALAPALVGMMLGQWVRARVRSDVFRICFFLGSLLLGIHLLVRALI
jgi:uncharacterized membrane protein YfcA